MSENFFSQAGNFISALNTQVDPRTGQFMVNLSLATLIANNQLGPELPLRLSYSPLNTNNMGFGVGFSLGITMFNNRSNLLELGNGEKYKVRPGTDSVRNQKLASFHFRYTNGKNDADGYTIVWKDGRSEQLHIVSDNETYVTTSVTSPLGRILQLEWAWSGQYPLLTRIRDKYRTLCDLAYGVTATMTFWPGTSEEYKISFKFINDMWLNVISFNPAGKDTLQWFFEYSQVDGSRGLLLTHIKYPTGMTEEVQYNQDLGLPFPDASDNGNLPAVLSHTRTPGGNQPQTYSTYAYTQQNFLGYNSDFGDWSENSDYIYHTLTGYVYGSTETVQEQDTKVVTQRTYNNYHLQISEVVTSYTDESGKTFAQSTLTEFDESGNPVKEVTPVIPGQLQGAVTVTEWYDAAGENGCPAEPNGFVRFMKKQTVTPLVTAYDAPVRETCYTYKQLGDTNCIVLDSRADYAGGVLLQQQTMTYDGDSRSDEFGRMTALTSMKFDEVGNTGPYITRQDFITTITGPVMTQKEIFTGYDQVQAVASRSQSVLSGRVSSHTDAQGISVEYRYDKLGRLQTQTNAAATEYETTMGWHYSIGQHGPETMQTDTVGNKVKVFFDGEGRSVRQQHYDADISRQWYDISSNHYNALGEFSHGTGHDWMTSSSTAANSVTVQSTADYDNWGKARRLSFSDGLEQHSITDPVAHTSQTYSAGNNRSQYQESGRTLTVFDVRSKLPLTVHYHDVNGNPQGTRHYSWDGLGRLRKEIDELGHETTRTYDVYGRLLTQAYADGTVVERTYAPQSTGEQLASIRLTGLDAHGKHQTWLLGTQTYDSLGRLTARTSGGRTTSYHYNGASPVPEQVTLPSGKTVTYTYIPELGNAVSSMTADGVTQTFQYDSRTGDLLQAREADAQDNNHWTSSGKLAKETFMHNGASRDASYNWTLNGEPLSYTDITGSQTIYNRDDYGKVVQIVDDALTVDLEYDALGRVVMQTVRDASSSATLRTSLVYDDFGREKTRTLFDSTGTTLVITQEWLPNNLLAMRVTKQDGNTVRQENYAYDERNRLVNYKVSGSDLAVDGYGFAMKNQHYRHDALNNLVSVTTTLADGTTDVTTCFYENSEDPTQLTSLTHSHASYPPAIKLAYDAEGRMTSDEAGRELVYDVLGRLVEVREQGHCAGSYHYDAYNRLINQTVSDGQRHDLYYRAAELVNEVTG